MYIEDELYRLVREFLNEENVTGETNHIVNQRIGLKEMHMKLNIPF